MPTLIFKAKDIRRVVEHSINAPAQRPITIDYDDDGKAVTEPAKEPSILLVHDEGIYVMSNGEPADQLQPDQPRLYVAYARGYSPSEEEYYERSRDAVGGDDFVETLPWATEIKRQIDKGVAVIQINYSSKAISLRPRR